MPNPSQPDYQPGQQKQADQQPYPYSTKTKPDDKSCADKQGKPGESCSTKGEQGSDKGSSRGDAA